MLGMQLRKNMYLVSVNTRLSISSMFKQIVSYQTSNYRSLIFSKCACQLRQLQYLYTSDCFKIVNEGLDLEDVVS